MSLIKTWMPHFQSSVRMRGREYQRAGRVKRLPAREGEIIRSEVQGSQKYTVVIKGESDKLSRISIRTGVFGDDAMQHRVLEKIRQHLGTAPAPANVADAK